MGSGRAGGQCRIITPHSNSLLSLITLPLLITLTHYSPLRVASRRGGRSSKGKEVKRVLPIRKVNGGQHH